MKKMHIIISELFCSVILITGFSSSITVQRTFCELYPKRVLSVHNTLKELIKKEMLDITDNLNNREKLKEIWYEGGNRGKIEKIISTRNTLSRRDLHHLKQLISQEKRLLAEKIKKITVIVNQDLHNQLAETLKFQKTEEEIENILHDTKISAPKLIREEHRIYNAILNKIDQINSINAYN